MDSGETKCIILPDDLLEGILSRMPVRDLLRMRCVSKSWRALIDDSSFISMHHHAQLAMCKENEDVPRFLWERSFGLYLDSKWYLLSKQQGEDIILNLYSDLERDRSFVFTIDPSYVDEYVICRGSANGIICLEQWCRDQELMSICISCGLWNPATRDFKMITYPDAPDHDLQFGRQFTIVGFMFHSLSNDLKIMTYTQIVSDKHLAYDIYSHNTNSWKRLQPPLLLDCLAVVNYSVMDACINGVYYWISSVTRSHMHPKLAEHHLYWVLSFDMSTEIFKFSDLPEVDWDYLSPPCTTNYDIGLYKECLAVFVTRKFPPDQLVGSVYIWVATDFDDGDFGVPLAWQCLFSSRQFDCINFYGPRIMTVRMDGDLLLLINGDLCLYNPTTDTISSFSISISSCRSYVVSLYPLSRVVRG